MSGWRDQDPGHAPDLLLEALYEEELPAGLPERRAVRSAELLDAFAALAREYGFRAERRDEGPTWTFRRRDEGPVLEMWVGEAGELAGAVLQDEERREVEPGRDLLYDPSRDRWLGPASKSHSRPGLAMVRFTALEQLTRVALALVR